MILHRVALSIVLLAGAAGSAAVAQIIAPPESAAKPPAEAKTVVDSAVKKAKAEKKTVFIHFSASW
jgi:hypothetical protein